MNVYLFFHVLVPYLREKCLEDLFPKRFMNSFPYDSVLVHRCIVNGCGRPIDKREMFLDQNGFPSAICSSCFLEMTSRQTEECWVCGDSLEDWRLEMQKARPHDVDYKIHELRCRDYFSIVSVKAMGLKMPEFLKK
jgi:hypothetical protein